MSLLQDVSHLLAVQLGVKEVNVETTIQVTMYVGFGHLLAKFQSDSRIEFSQIPMRLWLWVK